MRITAEQIRAARALLRRDQSWLAQKSGVSLETIKRFEGTRGYFSGRSETIDSIRVALEHAGVEFIPESIASGAGVRLTRDPAAHRALVIADEVRESVRTILTAGFAVDPALSDSSADNIARFIIQNLTTALPPIVAKSAPEHPDRD